MENSVNMEPDGASSHRPALALSAGGARGAYQIGCWKAFREAGVSFAAVAGSSIGAVNGALVCQNDFDQAYGFWMDLAETGILGLDYGRIRKIALRLGFDLALFLAPVPNLRLWRILKYALATAKVLSKHGTIGGLGRDGIVGLDRFEPLLDRHLDVKKIIEGPVPLFVTAYKSPRIKAPAGQSHHFRLQDFDEKDARRIMAASVALPVIFPAIELNGTPYRDGGIGNWAPIAPLYETGHRDIVLVSTKPIPRIDHSDHHGCRILQVSPDTSLGRFPFSTFRFTTEAVKQWMDLGYKDACRALDRS